MDKLLFILLLICWGGQASAQAPPPAQQNDQLPLTFLPKSPTVAPFQRFDKQENVNLITGAAQAMVPLASLRSGSLQTEVSLSYSFSGLKVVQPPDLVGLGWFLQAGGAISRRVSGRLDESPGGYGPYCSDSVEANRTNPLFLKSALQGNADTGPDTYDFSVGGYQGRFLIRDTAIVLLPQQPLQIRRLSNGTGFQIAAESGVRYVFTTTEVTVPHHQNFGQLLGAYTSSWHLTQIISAGNADTIQFHYSDWSYQEKSRVAQTSLQVLTLLQYMPVNYLDKAPQNTLLYGSIIHTKVLDSVTTRGARLLIQRNGRHEVQRVCVVSTLHGQRAAVRTMELGHSTFPRLSALAEPRLRLDWVQESNGSQRVPAYRFAYDTTAALPATTSTGQDHWGYYNGAGSDDGSGLDGTSALLPHAMLARDGLSANRAPDWSFTGLGALIKISYPTGGATSFAYEPNSYAIANRYRDEYQTHTYAIAASGSNPTRTPSPLHLRGIRYALKPPATVNNFDNHPCAGQALHLLAPTSVRFVLGVNPLHDDLSSPYSNILPDFILVRNDTILEEHRADAGTNSGEWNILLPPGDYMAWVIAQPDGVTAPSSRAEFNTLDITLPSSRVRTLFVPGVQGDGIRVRQTVTTTTGAPALTHTYSYEIDGPDGPYSSGTMLLPITDDGAPIYHSTPFQEPRAQYSDAVKLYLNFTSDNTRFGDEYSKYSFYYACVTEQEGNNGSPAGKTVHRYSLQPNQFNDVRPVSIETYRTNSTTPMQFQRVQAERYHYGNYSTQAPFFVAVRPYDKGRPPSNNPYFPNEEEQYGADLHEVHASFLAPDTTINVQYGPAGDSVVTTTRTSYRQQRPVRTAMRTSDGNQRISTVSYLSDYAPILLDFAQLRAHNFNPIVEVQQWYQRPGQLDSVLIGATLTRHNPRWQQPASTWRLDLAEPVAGPNALSLVNGLRAAWLSDTRYRRVATEQYDPTTGDPTGQVQASGPATAYVWGYQRTEVIAQAQNATAAQVAYTGFEAGELGRWQGQAAAIAAPGYTGTIGYNLTSASGLSCQQVPPGQYLVQCRLQGTGGSVAANGYALRPVGPAIAGWTAYTALITIGSSGMVQVTGSGHMDDVSLCPVGARLTTYTHVPLVGMASKTDPDGRTSTYEYDDLGRLVRTRDEQGRLLSQQEYHYARP